MPVSACACYVKGTLVAEDGPSAESRKMLATVARQLPNHDHRVTFDREQTNEKFHCLVQDGVLCLCSASADTKFTDVYGFLQELQALYRSAPGGKSLQGTALRDHMRIFNAKPSSFTAGGRALDSVQRAQAAEKERILESLDELLHRSEKIDALVDRQEELQRESYVFLNQAKSLKRAMIIRRIKIVACLVTLVAVILAAVALIVVFGVCHGEVSRCRDPQSVAPSPTLPNTTVVSAVLSTAPAM